MPPRDQGSSLSYHRDHSSVRGCLMLFSSSDSSLQAGELTQDPPVLRSPLQARGEASLSNPHPPAPVFKVTLMSRGASDPPPPPRAPAVQPARGHQLLTHQFP